MTPEMDVAEPLVDLLDVTAYRRDGWLHLPGLIDDERLATWRAESEELLARPELFHQPGRGKLLKGATRSDRLDPVIDVSDVFAAAASDACLVGVVEALLGAQVQLFKDKFIAKPSGAPGYGAHQDLPYWPGIDIAADDLVTLIVFLDAADAENGALECAPGQHRSWLTEPGIVADPEESQLGAFRTLACDTGDVVLLHALTPHRSGPNRSDRMRRTLLFTYAADDTPDLWRAYQDFRAGRVGESR